MWILQTRPKDWCRHCRISLRVKRREFLRILMSFGWRATNHQRGRKVHRSLIGLTRGNKRYYEAFTASSRAKERAWMKWTTILTLKTERHFGLTSWSGIKTGRRRKSSIKDSGKWRKSAVKALKSAAASRLFPISITTTSRPRCRWARSKKA